MSRFDKIPCSLMVILLPILCSLAIVRLYLVFLSLQLYLLFPFFISFSFTSPKSFSFSIFGLFTFCTLFSSSLLLIYLLYATDYSFMAEHTDLRHIMGVGIAITRGSAASLSFCYSLLLLTMSRNLLTKLKEFSVQQYIPLDAHIQFHKIAACTALFFSLLHTVGHIVNFYHVSTQPVEHLRCLTSEVSFPSDYKPGISFWLFQTITGKSSSSTLTWPSFLPSTSTL